MIRFRSPDLKGADLSYPHARLPSDKWDYWSGYYADNTTQSLSALGFPGVLWLCIVAESLYLTLLFTGGALMILELCPCFSIMNKLKLSAFAAMCTALSGNTAPSASQQLVSTCTHEVITLQDLYAHTHTHTLTSVLLLAQS